MSEASSPESVAWPAVDVVMPVRNEADHLAAAVAAVRAQRYPGTLLLLLAVAASDDDTEALAARIAASVDDVTVVPNPAGTTPAGLNVAIRAGAAPVVVRVDGHSQLPPDYVRRAVETLGRTGAANVGGRQVPRPTTEFEAAVAAATSSWLGTGGATYRVGGAEGPVDTVYLGVFERAAIEEVGLFDERLIRNQDYELNIRLRRAGHVVWFDPELWVGYVPRGSWSTLIRQYFEYGVWKAEVLRLHPGSLRARQLVPPLAVAATLVAGVVATRWRPAAAVPALYGTVVAVTASRVDAPAAVRARCAGIVPAIHTAWSAGVLTGLVRRSAGDQGA